MWRGKCDTRIPQRHTRGLVRPQLDSSCSSLVVASPIPSPMRSPAAPSPPAQKRPCCQALYDFSAENPGELEFKVRVQ